MYGYPSGFRFGSQGFSVSGVSFDTDAQAFFTAAGITDATQKNAVNTLVVDLKDAGVWTKCLAIYPFVGGSATTHKYNLKDPRDLDAAYRQVFAGGWTHSATGALPNGTTGYSDTKLALSTLTNNDTHMSYYSGSDTLTASFDMGAINGLGGGFQWGLRTSIAGGDHVLCDQYDGGARVLVAASSGAGMFISTRNTDPLLTVYRNGVSMGTSPVASGTATTDVPQSIYIGARNLGGAANGYGNKECRFVSVGSSLSAGEAGDLNTIVVAYQTALSRT